MNDHAPPLDNEAVMRAVRVPEQHKLTVLEENWSAGGHQVTAAAVPVPGILATGDAGAVAR